MGNDKISLSDLAGLLDAIADAARQGRCTPDEAVRKAGDVLAGSARDCRNAYPIGDLAGRMRRLRARRNEILGAPLFKDPAWDMLLELFAAHDKGDDMSVTSLCYASGVPLTTALRYLTRMEQHGLITREGDPADLRRCYVRATPKAVTGIIDAGNALVETVRLADTFGRDEA